MRAENYGVLRKLATDLGVDLFGVAETVRLEKYIDDEIKVEAMKLPYVISIGIRLQRAVLRTLVDHPNKLYKTHYRQTNCALDRASHELSRYIQGQGFNAIPIAASFILDWQKQNAHLSHRHAALEAGLGFWGKNNLLVHPEYGAGVRLSSLFTDMPLDVDRPIANDCGDCLACMIACPADAISENGFDFDRCYAQIKEFSKRDNYNLHICGLCVKACADARS